ncbi:MAG TPA: 3-hydroxyacyl-CoA dehydrogenase NAD-binding domain-containing protein [Thermoanaerobaculia bacterium]|nr:3-hydroxyacyl-CoA dehydrogenase NAD-binding domain-containing protein [Thermoanaerobaculia bacterium]
MSHDLSRIAVLGAGTMGRGIAQVAAVAGYTTSLFDVNSSALESADKRIRKNLDKGVELGKLAAEVAAAATGRLSFSSDLSHAVGAADLVIEAVPESMNLKIEIFQKVARHCPAGAIFASNTSALSITEMAAGTDRPRSFIGMHFFNPVHLMRLVEVIRGLETSESAVEMAKAVSHRMGKETVLVNESPGFVTSRINALIGNEAFRMLQEGVASAEDIDKALKLGLNHPMGPFEMVDLVGLDVRLSILEFLHRTLGEAYRPNNLLVQYVRAGRIGRKAGRGIYDYDDDGNRKR